LQEDNRLPPEISVKDIMDGWTLQEGYPVVKVEISNENFVQLSQKRFYLNPAAKATSNSTWLIPINLAYPKAQDSFARTTASDWMLSTGTKLNLFVQQKPYIINVQETGYYRVNYDNQNWNDIIKVLAENHSQIHELNRAQLIDDSMNLARAKQVSYEVSVIISAYRKQ
jgi:aminopeptidase N